MSALPPKADMDAEPPNSLIPKNNSLFPSKKFPVLVIREFGSESSKAGDLLAL
jgi:hypothetical protein